jgi:copper transport protein
MPTRPRPLPDRAAPQLRRRSLRRRGGSLLAVLAALFGLMLAGATAASAHAALLSTDPTENSVVQTAPTEVTLHFSEQVTLETDDLRVFDPSGKRVDSGPTGHAGSDDTTAQVKLESGLAQGTYTVAWRAISADTHPVSGAFTFSYGHASTTTAVAGEQAPKGSALVGALYGGSRSVQYGSYALLVGAVVMVLVCWPRGVRLRSVQRLMLGGWAGLLLATVAELLLRGPYAAASGLGGAFNLTLIQQSLSERLGTLLIVRVLLLAAAGVFLSLLAGQAGIGAPAAEAEAGTAAADAGPERRLRIALGSAWAVLAIALACTWALGDHASVGMQVDLAVPLDVIHVLAMACWLGGLATVLVGLRRTEAEGGVGGAQVARFSALAMASVAALVSTGVYQAWRGLGSWGALVTTTYGRLLLVKIGAVLVMLAAAWMSRRWTAVLRTQPEPAADAAQDDAADSAPVTARVSAPVEAPAEEEGQAEDQAEGQAEDPVRRAQLARQRALRAGVATQRARAASPARGRLLRSVLLEVAFAVVVLVVTTLLTNAPPGREVSQQAAALAATQNQPVNVTLPYDTGGPGDNADGKVNIEIDPARTGLNTLHAYVFDKDGKPVDVPELDVTLSLAAKDLGPLTVPVDKVDLGHWAASNLELPLQGRWLMAVSIRSDAIDETTVSTTIQVG